MPNALKAWAPRRSPGATALAIWRDPRMHRQSKGRVRSKARRERPTTVRPFLSFDVSAMAALGDPGHSVRRMEWAERSMKSGFARFGRLVTGAGAALLGALFAIHAAAADTVGQPTNGA